MKRLALCAVLLALSACGLNEGGGNEPNPVAEDTTAPTVPANLVATAESARRVTLRWTPSSDGAGSGVAGYRIYRNGGADPIGTSGTAGYTDDAVVPGMTYLYQVRAFDSARVPNVSNPSSTATVSTPNVPVTPTAPSVPENLGARANSPTSVTLSWSASLDGGSGVGGYRLYRNDRPGGPIATLSGTTFEDTSVVAATTYTYRVQAFDATADQNGSALSGETSVTTPASPPPVDATPPTAPTNLDAKAPSQDRVELSWNASTDVGGSGVGGYRIYRNDSATELATVTTTSYVDASVSAGTAYSYVVRAFDLAPVANVSDPSNTANVTTPAQPPPPDTTAPSVPANVQALANTATQVIVSWNASTDTGGSGLAGYRIFRNGVQVATATATTYTDNAVVGSTSYSYRVSAFDAASPPNESAQSAAANVTTPAPPDTVAPSVPANVQALASSATQVVVSWSASTDTGGSGLAGYYVYRDSVLSPPVATVTTTSYTDNTVAAGTNYLYYVAAFDAATPANVSAISSPAAVTTPDPPDTTAPSVPNGLAALAQSPTEIRLTWNASTDTGGSGLAGYRIYRDGTFLATATTTAFADTGVASNTTYAYTVSAYDAATPANESAQSTPASASTPPEPDTTPPGVPTGLVATTNTPTAVVIAWTASTDNPGGTGVAGYRVFRDGVLLGTVTTTTYTDNGVAASTTYAYTVMAFDGATPPNASAASAPLGVTTPAAPDTTAPSVPTGLAASANSATSVSLSWSASTDSGGSGLAGYRIFRDGAPIATSPTNAYTDNTVVGSTSYSYRVSAYDGATPPNESAQSSAAGVTTPAPPDTTAPSVPANVQAVANSATQVVVSWSASTDTGGSGLAGYRIFRNGVQVATATTTSYTDNAVVGSTGYSYRVSAYDAATPPNESAQSAAANVTTPAPPDTTAPSVPVNVQAVANSATQVVVSWNASTDTGGSGLAGYRIFRNGVLTSIATVSGTSYTDNAVSASTSYTYYVSAFDAATPPNESALSAPANVTTPAPPDTTAPSVPTGLTAVANSATSVSLGWNASTDTGGSGLAGYRIFRNGTPIATTGTNSYTDNTAVGSTAYAYRVSAYDAANPANESAQSAPANVTTPAPPDTTAPSVPANVQAIANSPTQVMVSWSASTDAGGSGLAGYNVYRNGGPTPIAIVTGTSHTDNSVVGSTAYSYRVSAFDNATPPNVSAMSAAANVTTPAPPDTIAPSTPTNLSATANSATQVQLTWTASTDAGGSGLAGYRIVRNGAQIATSATASYTDNGVVAETAYAYQVSAYDNATPPNVSGLSNTANVTTPPVSLSGLDTRPSNTSCLAGNQPSSTIGTDRVFDNLSFNQPVKMIQAPNDSSRWYVVQKEGQIRRFPNQQTVTAGEVTTFYSRSVYTDNESGLLGLAFHPNYPTDPRAFIFYINASPWQSRLSVLRTTDGGNTLNASTEQVLLSVGRSQPNHNGGDIAFGPDGFLYISTGDGGGGGDEFGAIGNGQNLQTVLGKMLRIDVGSDPLGSTYTIPATNPYASNGGSCTTGSTGDTDGCREIYAFGLRNPWRWSFDHVSGDLWVADVGQGAYEEVNKVVLGGNYGWRCREGAHNYNTNCGTQQPRLDPVAEYGRSVGYSITGGFVYRGVAVPALQGRYVFGDYGSGRIFNIATNTSPTLNVTASHGFTAFSGISAFAQDSAGEVYVLNINNGQIHQIVQQVPNGGSITTMLSQSGCALASDPKQPSAGMIPFEPNAPFWSDAADKTRWLALPNSTTIGTAAADGDWNLPNGSVLRKDFRLGARLIETRLFMRHNNGNWAGYTYEWNAAQTDATRVIGGKAVNISGQTWLYPSEGQCTQCHTSAAGGSLGLETSQLNGDILYPTTARTANQLYTLNHIAMLNPGIVVGPATPKMPTPDDPATGTLGERARAWLHTNCSFCHRPGGGTPSSMDLRYATALVATNACNVAPTAGSFGLPNARIIAPGTPGSSVLLHRIDTRNAEQMPPLASEIVDDVGVQLIQDWIQNLAGCN